MMTDDEDIPQGPEDADLADNADLASGGGNAAPPSDAGGEDEGPQRDAIFSKTHPAVRAALDDAGDYLTDDSNPPKADSLFSKTHPALQAFVDSIPEEIRGEGWFGKQIKGMNDWVHGRDLADASQAQSEEYVANLGKYKDGLIKMVQADPTAVSVALDSIKPTLGRMIGHLMEGDQAKAVYADLAGHATSEVTEAAVRAMATKSTVMAQRMLDSSLGVHLSDTQTKDLTAYIHAQGIAMGADHAAAQTEVAKDTARSEAAAGHRYGEELVNPVSGKAEFANGWASRMMADPSVAPEDKGALMNMYGKLQTVGDVAESNGHVVRDAINQMQKGTLTSKDIWDAVGRGVDGLSMNDGKWLNSMLHDETPGGKANREGFAKALNDAATQLMGKTGEEGASGRRNFNNYSKWLVGGYQQRGLAGLDPDSDGYMFKQTTPRSFQDNTPVVFNQRPSYAGAAPTRQVASYFRRAPRSRR